MDFTDPPTISANPTGITLCNASGHVTVPWADVQVTLAAMARQHQGKAANDHLATHARLSAPGLAAVERADKL
jgi:hypothetical protein